MSERNKELEAQEFMQKNVAYYQTFLNAWVENRMELDKQLLTLSSLAIGLLMIFYDKLENVTQLILWLLAGGLFITTIIIVLCIFQNNSRYIEYIVSESDDPEKNVVEKKLQSQTTYAFGIFILAIVLTFALAIAKSDFIIIKQKEVNMTEKKILLNEGCHGAEMMKPSRKELQNGMSGAERLPAKPQPAPQPTPTTGDKNGK